MGIKGLTSYIVSHKWPKSYDLHGGYLVIDGQNLAIELYNSAAKSNGRNVHCNCAFGGDYNIYFQHVTRFFDNLEKCEVTPIVLMDGGMEDKKCDMLETLGLAQQYQEEISARSLQERFKFNGNIHTLKPTDFWREDMINLNSDSIDDDATLQFAMQSDPLSRFDTLPHWFKNDYNNVRLSRSFIDMIFHRVFIGVIQIEDPAQSSAEAISLNIIRVIDGLLVAGREEATRKLTSLMREGRELVPRQLDTVYGINRIYFPELSKLRDTPLSLRKQIFDETLEISREVNLIEDIPPEWRLYIIAASYWMNQPVEPARNTCHIYALLFTMLLGLIDQKLGNYRPLNNLMKKFKIPAIEIKSVRMKERSTVKNGKSDVNSIIEALKNVSEGDCLEAVGFFVSNYEEDEIVIHNSQEFDVKIVHAFSQFQSCFRNANGLNVLLGCPYEYSVIGELYNGTMLYNLYLQFEKYRDVELYIAKILDKAPSFLLLLNLLIAKMKMLVDKPLVDGYREKRFEREINERKAEKDKQTKKKNGNKSKNKTKLNKKKNSIVDEDEEYDEWSDCSIEDIQINCDEYQISEDVDKQLYSPKVKRLLDSDLVGINTVRGVTKRKNKKKRRKPFWNEYPEVEHTVYRRLLRRRRLPKCHSGFKNFDISFLSLK